MTAATQNNWPLLGIFASSLLTPLVYVVAGIAGWIDWAVWSPIAICAALLAWVTASYINRPAE